MLNEETQAQTTAQSDFPKSRWARAALLLAGILVGQVILYGPSLAGRKVLLPLDLLAEPGVYLPHDPHAEPIVPENPIRSDLIYAEPYRQFAVEEVRAGRCPIWFPYQFGGDPLNFPVALPSYLLGYVMNSPAAIAWGRAMLALIAGVGAYLFCRRTLALGVWPSIFAGWTYPLTGYMIFWQGYAQDSVISWLPVLLMAVDATMRGKSRWAGAALALATTIVIISGPMDIAGQVLLVSGLYALWCFLDAHLLTRWHPRRALLALAATVMGWSLGLLVASPQIWHLLEYSRTGSRMQQRSTGSEERPPVGLAALPQTTFPDMYGSDEKGTISAYPPKQGNHPESSAAGYTGLLATLLLMPLAWCSRRHRSILFFLLFLGIFALSWQLGVPGLVDILRMPGLNMFSHNRFVFATSFALLAMAAIGMDALGQGECRWRHWFWAPVALLAGLCGWFAWSAAVPPESIANRLSQLAEALRHGASIAWLHAPAQIEQVKQWYFQTYVKYSVLSGLVLCAWLLLWPLGKVGPVGEQPRPLPLDKRFRWLLPSLAVLQLCDLMWFGFGRSAQCDPALYYPRIPALEEISRAAPGRVIGFNCLPALLASTHKLRDVRGYDAIDPRRWLDLMFLAGIPKSMEVSYARSQYMVPKADIRPPGLIRLHPVLDMLGVRYVIFRGTPREDMHPTFASPDYWVLTNEMALPRVFVPRRVETVADWDQLKKKMVSKFFVFQTAVGLLSELASNVAQFASTLPDTDPRKADLRQKIAELQETAKILDIAKSKNARDDFDPRELALMQRVAQLLDEIGHSTPDPHKAVEYQETADILKIADTLDAKDDFQPREVAYAETPLDLPSLCVGTAKIVDEIPNRILVSADMETAGMLVLTDLWEAGWKATVNGSPAEILMVNHAVRGVQLPAGKSTIEFRYEPRSLAWGLPLSGLALLASIGWLGVSLRYPAPMAPVPPEAPVAPVEPVLPPNAPKSERSPGKPGSRRSSKRRAN